MTRLTAKRSARIWLLTASLALLTHTVASTQETVTASDPLESQWRSLQKSLHLPNRDRKGMSPSLRRREERIELLRKFVRKHEQKHRNNPSLLKARSELGLLCLRTLQTAAADAQFGAILDADGHGQIDIHQRALYGLAQLRELEGKTKAAKQLLGRLIVEGSGTRYTDLARAAQKRIARGTTLKSGHLAPDFRGLKDLQHRSHNRDKLRGSPSLLIFWFADQPASLRRTIRASGLPAKQIIAFAIGGDKTTIKRRFAVKPGAPEAVIIHLDRAFLEDVILDYGVRSLPSTFLLDSQCKLVARNLPAQQLGRAVMRLQSGKKK